MTKEDLEDLSSENPKVKYRRVRNLLAIAREDPQLLYPHRRFFIKLLASENNILKWMAIDIIGCFCRVHTWKSVDKSVDILIGLLRGGRLITANHAIGALAQIGLALPKYRDKIVKELLGVERYAYETEECRNIALGKVIEALALDSTPTRQDDQVVAFVRRQTSNTRPATRKKAERFLKNAGRSDLTAKSVHR